jgi:hypothetical protein
VGGRTHDDDRVEVRRTADVRVERSIRRTADVRVAGGSRCGGPTTTG